MMQRVPGVLPAIFTTLVLTGVIADTAQAESTSPAAACDDPRSVEAFGSAGFVDANSRSVARQEAIRQALLEALQSAGGADIARSAQTATRSTLSSIERETHEHVVVRSDGRITGWTVVEEYIESGAEGERLIALTLGIDLCFDQRATRPLVVALADPTWETEPGLGALRLAILQRLGQHVRLTPSTDRPGSAYHDVAIKFDHIIEREAIDRRPQADILAQFGGGRELAPELLQFDIVVVRASVSASRFVDRKTFTETTERRARIAKGAAMEATARDLAFEAYLDAASAAIDRLQKGELDY